MRLARTHSCMNARAPIAHGGARASPAVDDPVPLDRHRRFYATCTRVDGADRRDPHADTIDGVVA